MFYKQIKNIFFLSKRTRLSGRRRGGHQWVRRTWRGGLRVKSRALVPLNSIDIRWGDFAPMLWGKCFTILLPSHLCYFYDLIWLACVIVWWQHLKFRIVDKFWFLLLLFPRRVRLLKSISQSVQRINVVIEVIIGTTTIHILLWHQWIRKTYEFK